MAESSEPTETVEQPVEQDVVEPPAVDETPPQTAPAATAITEISPQAVPSLGAPRTAPDPADSGEFALDPDSTRVQAAVDDLAGRLEVPRDDVVVLEARAVTWGDSSLGCPQPGMKYLPRVTDGSRVVLGVDDVEYVYTGGEPLRWCENAPPR